MDTGRRPKENALAAKRRDAIARIDRRIQRNAQGIVAKSELASYLDDDGKPIAGVEVDPDTGRPKGWTARDMNIAKDWRKTDKFSPGYLKAQVRILDSYKRAEKETAAPAINAEVVNVQINSYAYPTRVVDED